MAPFSIAEGIIKVFLKWSGWKLTMFLRDQLQIGHYKEPPDAGRQLWLSVGAFPMAEYTKCHSWIILATYGKSIGFRNDCLFWRHVPVLLGQLLLLAPWMCNELAKVIG